MNPDNVPREWVDAGAQALVQQRVEIAWGDLGGLTRAAYRRQARHTIAAVIPQVKAAALREFAAYVREAFPEDVFIPPTRERLHEVHEWLKQSDGTLDAISAHLMRLAARNAEIEADRIEADQ